MRALARFLPGILPGILRCDRGAAIIEMGLVAPLLATLLLGMVDVARAYSSKLELEQAAQRTIEKVMQQRNVASDYSTLLAAEAATAAGVSPAAVTVDSWLECNGARQDNFDGACSAGQTFARYVTVDIERDHTPMFGKFFGTVDLHGVAGVRVQ